MTTPLFMRKHHGALRPENAAAVAAVEKIANGATVKVSISQPRNMKHHRLFWALMRLVWENQEHYENVDHMVVALKVALGHCDTVITKDGGTAYIPKSISFAKMDQTAFNEFWDRCLHLICKYFLPGADREELTREVYRMIGEKMEGAMR